MIARHKTREQNEVIVGGGSFYSDVYSLGVTMYEMLTGRVPYYSQNDKTVVDNIRTQAGAANECQSESGRAAQ